MIAKPLLALGTALLTLAACGGSDSTVDRANGGAGTGSASTASSAPAEKSALCASLGTKKCDLGSSWVTGCEAHLAGTSSAYVQAVDRCVKAASSCDDIWDTCTEKALPEIAPGFPNLPLVTQCKDKNLECVTKYAPNSTDKNNSTLKSEVNGACELAVGLDIAGQNRAEECRAKDCDAFAECITELTDGID